MFCAAEVSYVSSNAVLTTVALVLVLVSTQLLSLKSHVKVSPLVSLACYNLIGFLTLVVVCDHCASVVIIGSLVISTLVSALVGRASTLSLSPMSLSLAPIALFFLCLASNAYGSLIAVELVSLSTLLLVVESFKPSSRACVLSYYWVSALCTITFVLFCAVSSVSAFSEPQQHSLAFVSTIMLLALGAKLGALPSGVWAV